jgi:hypothetical protein
VKIILAIVMLLLSATSYGQLVKCVSKDGKVEYARDCQPGTIEYQTGIRSSMAGAASAGAAPRQKSMAELDADYKKRVNERLAAQQKDAQKADVDSRNREACELAQAHLKTFENGLRMPRVDPKTGEITHASDQEREADTVKARAKVAENCK